jgi:hypothetical protein
MARSGRAQTRRGVMAGFSGLSAALMGITEGRAQDMTAPSALTIYSPAPPTNPLHELNLQLVRAAAGFPGAPPVEMTAMALPESINTIAAMRAAARPSHLPIVTSVDFRLAREGGGPSWHAYPRANRDLKFVARLYDVGFGILAASPISTPAHLRGKRIGAPPRPSAVRLLTETLLRDGWGVLDEVTLVDMSPPDVASAFASGAIDATSWNLVFPSLTGFRPILPDLAGAPSMRVLAVEEVALARVNSANTFKLELARFLPEAPPLLSFAQALAAWDDTDPAQIRALLACIAARGADYAGLPDDIASMARWPDLSVADIHPAARAFYALRGITIT